MRLGLATRLALIFAALVAATALATSGVSALSTNRQVTNNLDEFLRERADDLLKGEREGHDGRGGRRSDGEPQGAVDDDAIVQRLGRDGEVVSTSSVTLPVEAQDVALAERSGPGFLRTVIVDGDDYRMLTVHIEGGGAWQVARDIRGTNELLGSIRSRAVETALLMALGAGLVSWVVARQTMRPLRQLTQSVETVAATQDLSTPIDIDRPDEVGRLAASFDEMLQALARSRDQQHQLVQDAAHELRTPLTSIRANVDFLAHAPDLDVETRQEMLTGVRSELGQLNSLFTEIIELATDDRDAPSWQPVDLLVVAEAAVEAFRARSERTVFVEGSSSLVEGDPVALQRVIANLLSNADKYGGDGPVEVGIGAGSVIVRDHGPGVSEADLARAFDRFYRSPDARSQPGSGLGLAIVDKIITDHGGRRWLRNVADGGAEAGFELDQMASNTERGGGGAPQ